MARQPEREARAGPCRTSSGARERIFDAALEVLQAAAYAVLTTATVTARPWQNKAMIAYHFASTKEHVSAVGRRVRE